MTSRGRPYGSRRTYGASSTPVRPAVNEPNAQPAAATRSASMPPRTASRRSSTTARSSRPKRVQRMTAPTPAARTSATVNCPHGSADTSSGASSRAPCPHTSAAPPTSSTNTPMDATSVCAGSLPSTDSGRKTKRSSAMPIAGARNTSVATAPAHSGQPHSTTHCRSAYAHTMAIAPCAKFSTPVARYVTIRPIPVSAAALPTDRPARVRSYVREDISHPLRRARRSGTGPVRRSSPASHPPGPPRPSPRPAGSPRGARASRQAPSEGPR